MDERKIHRGRPRLGSPNPDKHIKFSMSLSPDLYERLTAYCKDEEREKSFAIRKALDPWLKERGY